MASAVLRDYNGRTVLRYSGLLISFLLVFQGCSADRIWVAWPDEEPLGYVVVRLDAEAPTAVPKTEPQFLDRLDPLIFAGSPPFRVYVRAVSSLKIREAIERCGLRIGGPWLELPSSKSWVVDIGDDGESRPFVTPDLDLDLRFERCSPPLSTCDDLKIEATRVEGLNQVDLTRVAWIEPLDAFFMIGNIESTGTDMFLFTDAEGRLIGRLDASHTTTSLAYDRVGTVYAALSNGDVLSWTTTEVEDYQLRAFGKAVRVTSAPEGGHVLVHSSSSSVAYDLSVEGMSPRVDIPPHLELLSFDDSGGGLGISAQATWVLDPQSGVWSEARRPEPFDATGQLDATRNGLFALSGLGSHAWRNRAWERLDSGSIAFLTSATSLGAVTLLFGDQQVGIALDGSGQRCEFGTKLYATAITDALAISDNLSVAVSTLVGISQIPQLIRYSLR